MRRIHCLNSNWSFAQGFNRDTVAKQLLDAENVDLPHSAVELEPTYCDETLYQREFTYQKKIDWDESFQGNEIFLRFEAAMANAVVFLNGRVICEHADGYTPFEANLTEGLIKGSNLVTVKIDGSENPDIPPFGGRIDYLTYAGIYRDVALIVASPIYIDKIKVTTPDALSVRKSVLVQCTLANHQILEPGGNLTATIKSHSGEVVAEKTLAISTSDFELAFTDLVNLKLWSIERPVLYTLELQIAGENINDNTSVNFGFRTAEFTPEGFKLNGEQVKLMGLNRHQSFPYSGYAQGRYAQERDVDILKNELSCNVVRSSHYPPSPWFLDHCDKLGLLVLEEIPGWQHIGGELWKQESIINVRRMIERDWNHPSIISWGVRINESADDHDFYSATNALARELDPSRQTSGIRLAHHSEFLEDIYTTNDFAQGDEELSPQGSALVPLRQQREITGLNHVVPYMVTEFNGHMFPTKVIDNELRQAEHVTRHLNILNQMFGDPEIAGCIGWCMFDYNTHKDFGSGDRICHHGVMSMHREPKFAAYAYASQGSPTTNPVLKPVTYWARGERNVGGVLPLIILTNMDEVELTFFNGASMRFKPDIQRYPHLPHAPVIINRDDIPATHFGQWGRDWRDIDIVGYVDGVEIIRTQFVSNPLPSKLEVVADKALLSASRREEVRVVIRALDQVGNVLPFLVDQINIDIQGPATLIGPPSRSLVGGSAGFWIRSVGEPGEIVLSVSTTRFATSSIVVHAGDNSL